MVLHYTTVHLSFGDRGSTVAKALCINRKVAGSMLLMVGAVDTSNMQSDFAVEWVRLRTVASSWIFINI